MRMSSIDPTGWGRCLAITLGCAFVVYGGVYWLFF